MELGLQFEDITYYESLESHAVTHEETLETAIPEYCPDMSRIVESVGELFVHEKIPAEDRYTVAGTVKVTVLYTSEESPGLKSLTVSVPFSARTEEQIGGGGTVFVTGRVLMLEARAVTSRRLHIRLVPEITAHTFRPQQSSLCVGVEPEPTLRVRREEITLPLLTGVAEQEIGFTGEAALPAGKVPEELLVYHLCPQVQQVQRLGGKLMVKGEVLMRALYRSGDALADYWEGVLPFSDVVDGAGLAEDGELVVLPTLTAADARALRRDASGGISVTAQISLAIRAYQRKTVSYIADLYSVRYNTHLEQQPVTVHLDEPESELTQEAVSRLELNAGAPFVYVTALECSPVTSTVEAGRSVLRTAIRWQALYLDESGSPITVGRTEEVTVPVEEMRGTASARCCTVTVQCSSACQIRVPVTFALTWEERLTVNGLTAVTMEEAQRSEPMPSLILRRMHPEETLWDVAKQYHTDVDAIRQNNRLEGDAPHDRMLLIPRVR